MKLPRVTGEKTVKALQHAGFSLVHVRGSHHYLHHPEHDCIVTVPVHAKKTLAPKTLKTILEQSHLSAEEFSALL
jgi:predicted RNA binding protein YcfA (HicA-like mRNA interferase family)